jgi:tetratricopeptide (TPR) repeat protein
MHTARTRLGVFAGALALWLSAVVLRTAPAERWSTTATYEDRYYLPREEWLPVFSLGYREALADFVWMRALVYYGEEMVHHGGLAHAIAYARAILTLDPEFRAAYRWIGIATFYGPQGPSLDEAEATMAMMEEGCAHFPDDGELQWDTGAMYAFEMPHMVEGDAERNRIRDRGVPHLVRAQQLGAAPPYAGLLNASLLQRVGRAEEAAAHLEELYAVTSDESLRAEIEARIETLRSDAFTTAFVEENRRFENEWGRQMPYAPASLYFLIGPVPVVDTDAVLRDGFGAHALDGESALSE